MLNVRARHTLIYTHMHTYACIHEYTRTDRLTDTISYTHMHRHGYAYTHTYTHMHTCTSFNSHNLILRYSEPVVPPGHRRGN